MAGFV
jgi:hypothetical protein